MEIVGWILVAVPIAVLGFAAFAGRYHQRHFPPGTSSACAQRKPGFRWVGWIHGGGHG